ncbi:aminoglycoside phosphotransferase family protein [Kitasatospora sp. NPDC059571]|uniref:aminoglycoside phosphotransferase family protein n=1 Tax=Kitasatospora sp. NPDC059571 TaxID=3346871 RepID=UPI0036A871FE
MDSAERTVTAVVTLGGERLGQVGPFPVTTPRWQDVAPVVRELERLLGVPALVLRLVRAEGGDGCSGGHVVYHAEALGRPARPLADGGIPLDEDPLRAAWATADGLLGALAWAEEVLAAAGRPATGPAEQLRTWNLSGLLRIPTAHGPVWLKTTPPFGADESGPIGLVASVDADLVPAVLGSAEGRLLLEHVPGVDCWGLPDDAMLGAVARTVAVQARLAGRAMPALRDASPRRLPARFGELLPRLDDLAAEERAAAERLLARLPVLTGALEACGLPDTLVHGDFHPGNWRSDGRRTVVVDFSDAYLGHPAFDGLRPRPFLSAERWEDVRALWERSWSAAVPGCDPGRALELARPLVHLSYAVRYQEFLDGIERSERVYHEGDPAAEVRRALAAAEAATASGR